MADRSQTAAFIVCPANWLVNASPAPTVGFVTDITHARERLQRLTGATIMPIVSINRLLCIAACALLTNAAWAEVPSRAGRITYLDGNTSVYQDRESGWQRAVPNMPVTSENSIWIDGAGRAELRIGAMAVRMSDDTVIDFVRILDDQTQAFLQRGTLNVRMRAYDQLGAGERGAGDNVQIETAHGRFILDVAGRYRIESSPATRASRIAVFSGRARFESGDNRLTIDAGKELEVRINGGIDSATALRFDTAAELPFDRWAESRDQQWDQAHARVVRETVISPYMTGYEDFDHHGDWIEGGEYGRVWAPRVIVTGWAPYRYGHWANVRPWGWTWVDDAPWGFAPFHYGRWVQVRSRWCWWPGPYVARPIYAPALVAWLGAPGIGIAISTGPGIGWFPLGPREHYIPRYTNNINYIRNINRVGNQVVVVAPGTYVHQVHGTTVVNQNIFINSRPVGSNVTPLSPRIIAGQTATSSFDIAPHSRRSGNPPNDRRIDGASPRPQFGNPSVPIGAIGNAPDPSPGRGRNKHPPQVGASGPLPVNPVVDIAPQPKPLPRPHQQGARGTQGTIGAPPVPAAAAPTPSAAPAVSEPRHTRRQPRIEQPPGANGSATPSSPTVIRATPPVVMPVPVAAGAKERHNETPRVKQHGEAQNPRSDVRIEPAPRVER